MRWNGDGPFLMVQEERKVPQAFEYTFSPWILPIEDLWVGKHVALYE
jgi:hypothetical protein